MTTSHLILVALAGLGLLFAGVYAWARRVDNYSIVDVAWSYAFGLLGSFYALAGSGWGPRRAAVAITAAAWSLRLGTHLLRRVARHHPQEDQRYTQLRRDWSGQLEARMFRFFQFQAVSVVVLGAAFLVAAQNASPGFSALEITGLLLWLVAVGGEATADTQLATFKRTATRGEVCDRGLWRYSRHPNYFFQWLIWVGWCGFALGSPFGWVAVVAPATILYLLLRVTGIPATEEQALRSKGEAYRRYQARTSAFIPWRPRSLPSSNDQTHS
jgi:steroid 5-alpha reductase family enzyme